MTLTCLPFLSDKNIARLFFGLAVLYLIVGLSAVIAWSPLVPFADAWRHYAQLVDVPFPASVFGLDNGHPEIFANLVRWISLIWLRGDERFQSIIGLLLALATLGVFLRVAWLARGIAVPARAAAMFALVLGIFWLGNARGLLHDNEALHAYSVLLCLALALSLCGNAIDGSIATGRIVGATLLCTAASFNFGSGVASFVALTTLLSLQRVSLKRFLIPAAGLAITLVAYSLLGDHAGGVAGSDLQLVARTSVLLRWLAAPVMYLFWPFVDPSAAASLPHPLDRIGCFAHAWTMLFGDMHRSVVPQVALGFALLGVLGLAIWRARRRAETTNAVARLGLSLAAFGVGVGVLVAAARLSYFAEFPTQIYAPRYLPWSSLAWAGLLTAYAAGAYSRLKTVVMATVAVLALGAEGGMSLVMLHERQDANDTALAAVVGVWPDGKTASENNPDDVRSGAAALRRIGAGPFAWPESELLGRELPANAHSLLVRWTDDVQTSDSTGSVAVRLQAVVSGKRCDEERLWVVEHGRVAGLLRNVGGEQWRGAARTESVDTPLEVWEPGCE